MNQPLISVIIPAKDAQDSLKKCLDSLLNLEYKDFEIIVIDDGSRDNTALILKEYAAKITLITNPSALGPSLSRNAAARLARGEYLAFTDSDCMADKFWLKELLSGFDGADTVSVGGIQDVPQDESDFGLQVSRFMRKIGFILDYIHLDRGKMFPVSHNPSCCAMYRKDVFLKEGGFLSGMWPGEDVELDYRLKKKGYRLIFNPKAVVYHYRPDNLKKFSRMMLRYGIAQGFLVRRYGVFRKIHFLPFCSAALLGLFILFGYTNLFYALLALLAAFVLAAVYLSGAYPCLLALVTLFYWHLGFIKGFFR